MVKKIFSPKGLKIICICLAAIALGALITGITSESISSAVTYRKWELRKKGFERMVESLEFGGLNDTAKENISELANVYGEYSNIIITDDAGKVIYNLNEGYMPDKDTFTVIVNIVNDSGSGALGYVIDKNENIKYVMYFDKVYNYSRLEDVTRASGLAEKLFFDDKGNKINVFNGHVFSTKYMNYAYIGSKGWNVYAIFNRTDAEYRVVPAGKIDLLSTIYQAGVMAFILFWLLLPIWVFMDARNLGFHPALWGLLALITNIIGLIVYLVVRPDPILCKNCKHILASRFVICPYCGEKNREICLKCKSVMEDAWNICPYCGEKRIIKAEDANVEVRETDVNINI